MEKAIYSGRQADYLLSPGKQMVVKEFAPTEKRYLKRYQEKLPKLFGLFLPKKENLPKKEKEPKVRKIGKYRVKETFAGEESLTSLLTQYVERTVGLRY